MDKVHSEQVLIILIIALGHTSRLIMEAIEPVEPMEQSTVRPQVFLSPNQIQQIASEIQRAPQQEFRGATPELVLPGAAARSGASTVALYAGDRSRMATPAPIRLQLATPAASTVAMYAGDEERRIMIGGDRNKILENYRQSDLCRQLVKDSLRRIDQALEILDKDHADIIRARLQKAKLASANSSHAGTKEISFKKAASIAIQAERWVYQAQAAAAKSMISESKKCLHNLAGRAKRTTAEKEAAYAARYGRPRGTRKERAARKLRNRLQKLESQ